jgi:uncharacterized membrane protein
LSALVVVVATFLAASVEWVEALTIVLAAGMTRGWRSAIAGTVLAVVALVVMIAILGAAITSRLPLDAARTVIGLLLLLFGLKWLYKAILRAGGLKALHDEAKAFAATTEELGRAGARGGTFDRAGLATSFTGVFLEGLEVVFIVAALGGTNSLPGAATGAIAALVVVLALGIVLRAPLTRIPENTLKFVVGIMLTAFGTFFLGEGIGVVWWNADLSLLPLIAIYLVVAVLCVALLRSPISLAPLRNAVTNAVGAAVHEVWGLFVEDGELVAISLIVVLGVALVAKSVTGAVLPALLVGGVLLAIVISIIGTRSRART